MKNLLQSIIVSFAMYSKIPMPSIQWTKENMKYAMCFFPLIGAVIGAIVYGAVYLLNLTDLSKVLQTSILVLIPVVITGGIHLDGLLDTSDALSSYQTQERRLEILKDSNSGAFAIIVGICYFIMDFGIWYDVNLSAVSILAIGYVLSRALSGYAVVSFKCARNSGLAATFSDMAQKKTVKNTMIFYIILCIAAMLYINLILGALAIAAAFLTFFYYRHMSYKTFGGITGDLAGFFVQIAELFMAISVIIGSIYNL